MRAYSGIQPTGRKHLGNYLGAIRQYVEKQAAAEVDGADQPIFCAVDLHATTVAFEPEQLRSSTLDLLALLIAAGLDPQKCVLYRQSDVPEVPELMWLLTSVTAHGDLNRMHQFKEKSGQQRELVSAGLFVYPILMAADVLAFGADTVPVGDDQRQHIELMRDIAERFNSRFGSGENILVPPNGVYPTVGARIMDLQDPTKKMSTSSGSVEGTLYVIDDAKAMEKKLMRAVTDSGSEIVMSPDKPGVSNLIEILAACSQKSTEQVVTEMSDARGYGDLKKATAAAVVDLLQPIQARYAELRSDETELEKLLLVGAEKASQIAKPIVSNARYAMGLGKK